MLRVARSLETGTYVLGVFLTKGCDLPPCPSVRTHGRLPFALELAFVRSRVFQHEKLTNVELMGFISDGEEVRDGHWEVGQEKTTLFGLICFDLRKFLPQWNYGSQIRLL